MIRRLAVANQKGGTGKTTTAWAIMAGAAARGWRTMAIDMDPQGNLSYLLNADLSRPTIADVLNGTAEAAKIVQQTGRGAIIPAGPGIASMTDTEALQRALDPIYRGYDLIVIDCPPTLGTPLLACMRAATEILIPLQADPLSIQGLYQMRGCIDQTQTRARIVGAFLTRYSGRSMISREMARAIRERCAQLNIPYIDTPIREGVAIREAQLMGEDIYSYAPRSNPAADYTALLNALDIITTID